MNDVICFILDKKALEITDEGYVAHVWGTTLTTGLGGVVVIYGTERDEEGNLTNVDFNLVAESEFPKIYRYID